MTEYSIIGRVIDGSRSPVPHLAARVYAHPEPIGADVLLGETQTDPQGHFELSLTESRMPGLAARLGRAPQVYLTLSDPSGRLLLTTRRASIEWQLEFRIYLGGGDPQPDAPDLYQDGIRRIVGMSREAGMGAAMQSQMKGLQGPELRGAGGIRGVFSRKPAPPESATDGINLAFALLDGVATDAIEGTPFKQIGYDGPQVPRNPWAETDSPVTIWPRKERFRWE